MTQCMELDLSFLLRPDLRQTIVNSVGVSPKVVDRRRKFRTHNMFNIIHRRILQDQPTIAR